jgi:diguanylate cyclase (GGDEF)-like protein
MDSRQEKMQRHRLRMTSISVVNALLQTVIVSLYAWSGTVTWTVAIAFSAASLVTTGLFTSAVAMGWLLRVKDGPLLYAQLAANSLIQLIFLVIAPQLSVLFLVSMLVTFNFVMLAFTPRQFIWGWLAFGATTAVALIAGRERFSNPAATDFNLFVLWLFFFFAVRRLAVIGAQFSNLREQLSVKNRQLTESLERINELAIHDELTGAFNRRHFIQLLTEERERANRTKQPFSVAIFDLDHFKNVNDRFGHLAGDAVLREFCALVHAGMRTTDRFARYGGEEFVMLMPATTPAESAAMAVERVRAAAEHKDWGPVLAGHGITTSAGVATYRSDESIEELLSRADAALYAAKHGGRNRLVIST